MSLAASQPAVLDGVRADRMVQASDLGKTIDDRVILSGLSFTIERGAFTALLGANGAGKTTLLKILATLVPPSTGELHLLGTPARGDVRTIRARLGLIGHSAMLYRDLTLLENLVIFGRLYGVRDVRARARELLDYVSLSDRWNDEVKTFSRGMLQRAAIARALMHDPSLILADEPFAGLDAPSRDGLEQMLRRLHAAGRTILVANHDIAQSLELTQSAMVLRRGRLVLEAPTSELSKAAVLEEVRAT